MSVIILPDKWRKQPPGPLVVDWGGDLAKAAKLLWIWRSQDAQKTYRSLRDYSRDLLVASDSSTPSPVGDSVLRAYNKASSQYTDLGFTNYVNVLSLGAIFASNDLGSFSISSRASFSTDGFEFLVGGSSIQGNVVYRVGLGGTQISSATVTGQADGRKHHYIGRWSSNVNGGAADIVADGIMLGTGSGVATGTVNGSQNWMIANRAGTYFTGYVELAYACLNYVPDEVASELCRAPWQLFRKQPRILYFTAPSGGGATIAGTFSGTDSVDTTSFSGDVLIQGTLAATDATDTTSFSGAVPISGTFSPTESAVDSALFEGNVVTAGVPTLSSPTVVSVTATSAIPRVTVTFA